GSRTNRQPGHALCPFGYLKTIPSRVAFRVSAHPASPRGKHICWPWLSRGLRRPTGSIGSAPRAWAGLGYPTRRKPRRQTPSVAARSSANQNTACPPRPQPPARNQPHGEVGDDRAALPNERVESLVFLCTRCVRFLGTPTVAPAGSIVAAVPMRILTTLSSFAPAGCLVNLARGAETKRRKCEEAPAPEQRPGFRTSHRMHVTRNQESTMGGGSAPSGLPGVCYSLRFPQGGRVWLGCV